MVRGKTEFTSSEYEKLIELVEVLQKVDPAKQKGIRSKLRALGLYWSEVGAGKAYTKENVEHLFKTGSLKIAGENGNTPATAVVEDHRPHIENSTTANRVFISYKRKNKDLVFPIKEKIERAIGEPCWIDLDGIESSAQFVKVIIKAIDRCEVFLFMHSSLHADISDIEKDWTIRELQYAEEENKRIVFINLDRSSLGKWFKFMFGQKQQIDALDPEAVDRLISDLKTWLAIPDKEDSEATSELNEPAIKVSSDLKSPRNSKTKTVRKVGDKHPTQPWVWTEYKPGKFDWRIDKSSATENAKDSGEDSSKAFAEVPSKILLPNELHIPNGTKTLSKFDSSVDKSLIENIFLPNSLTRMKEEILSQLPNLQKIIIPKGKLDKFGKMLPHNWWKMYYEDGTSVCPELSISFPKGTSLWIFPYGLTKIASYGFGKDANGHVLIPPTCTNIEKNAFSFNKNILSVTMPDSVSTIGKSAFSRCEKMESIRLSNKLKAIPKNMIDSCKALKEIIVPNGVTTIEAGAFSSCKNLVRVVLPSTIQKIDKGGFFGFNPFQLCDSLKEILVPKGTKKHFESILNGFSGNPARLLVVERPLPKEKGEKTTAKTSKTG